MIRDVNHYTPNEPMPLGKILDAEGKEIRDVVRCDTETGEVTQLTMTENGELMRKQKRFPAPLTFIPLLLALMCSLAWGETTAERLDDGIPAGSGAITPTKGSLWVANGTNFVPLAVGTNTHVLTADSAQTNGIKWAAAGAASVDTTANYTWTGTHTFDLSQIWKQQTTPSNPAATYFKVYFKSDGKLYRLNSSGTETEIGSGSVTSVTGTAPIASSGGTTPAISLNDAGVTYAKIQDVTARSVIGRAGATDGVTAAITASATGQVLRYSGTTIGFGALDLSDADAVTGSLPFANITGAAASGANTDLTSIYLDNAGLKLKDTNASHGLIISPGSNITADRTLTLTTGDADRTLTLSGNTTLAGGTHSGTNTGDQTFDGLSPLTTQGDLLYHNGANNVRLAKGTASQVLTMNAGATAPEWATPAGGAPFDDGTAIVKGSADATKLLRFEVDGFTAGQTRVVTPPDSNTSLPIMSYNHTFNGTTAARTIALPDRNITMTTATTADATADVLWGASATTQKALAIQAKASATVPPFEVQNSALNAWYLRVWPTAPSGSGQADGTLQTNGIALGSTTLGAPGTSSTQYLIYKESNANGHCFWDALSNSQGVFRIRATTKDFEARYESATSAGANYSSLNLKSISETVTIAAAATSDSATNLLPANAMIMGVVARVTTAIPTATTWDMGVSGDTARYADDAAVAVNTQTSSWELTTPLAPYMNKTAAKIRITPSATPANANGRVRIVVWYFDLTAPGS